MLQQRKQEEGKYILSNINIVDPIEGLSQNKSIIIEQGKVSDIVEKINPRDYKTYTIHDLSGKYIILGYGTRTFIMHLTIRFVL